ncbi:hypothetical protein COLO4_02093 [Corchorus olitorius]|uniref:Uncharacterized protein n=1 Tax=Corchorus olitorius TaxID=93759 RepID=A0A1R3L1H8_9ROSI|nr:hypothetical protein COLO4_02093 [Corchorus olitorius]
MCAAAVADDRVREPIRAALRHCYPKSTTGSLVWEIQSSDGPCPSRITSGSCVLRQVCHRRAQPNALISAYAPGRQKKPRRKSRY